MYIISMASSYAQRAAVQKQLRAAGIRRSRIWPGVVLDSPEQGRSLLHGLADLCVVPRAYAEEHVLPELRGTVGSTLAHLSLLHHASRRDSCPWVVVLADDVVLMPGFAS